MRPADILKFKIVNNFHSVTDTIVKFRLFPLGLHVPELGYILQIKKIEYGGWPLS